MHQASESRTHQATCACGTVLHGATGELLLEAVELHAVETHPEPTWRHGPSLADLRHQVVALCRRVERLEREAKP
jgi:hypothetical protein